MNRGILYGIAAYAMWGFFPIYWKLLKQIPSGEILVNRILWSFVFLVLVLSLRRQWSWIGKVRTDGRVLLTLIFAALLLAVNWFTYIWGVNNGFIVETSLGYFINPLVSVLLGVAVMRERLRIMQIVAVAIAALGVLYLTINYGSLPWIALTLALSFGVYGLIKKRTRLGSIESLTGEMAVLLAPALFFLIYSIINGSQRYLDIEPLTVLLLVGSGIVTTVPLLFFSSAAKQIPLSTIGLLQYIAPTLQFLIGVFIYQEQFNNQRLIGFVIIWLALLIYSADSVRHRGMVSRMKLA